MATKKERPRKQPKKPYDPEKRPRRTWKKGAAKRYQAEAQAMVLEKKWTAQDYLDALDMLARVHAHLVKQYYGATMPFVEAKAHFDARALLLRHRLMTCDEMERIFRGE